MLRAMVVLRDDDGERALAFYSSNGLPCKNQAVWMLVAPMEFGDANSIHCGGIPCILRNKLSGPPWLQGVAEAHDFTSQEFCDSLVLYLASNQLGPRDGQACKKETTATVSI